MSCLKQEMQITLEIPLRLKFSKRPALCSDSNSEKLMYRHRNTHGKPKSWKRYGEHVGLGMEVGPMTYLDHQTIDQMDHKIVRWARTEPTLWATKNPINQIFMRFNDGAGTRIRTVDLLITSQLLYQLSYAGDVVRILQFLKKITSQKMSI